MKRLEALVPLGVGRVLLTTESDTGLGAVDVAVLNSVTFLLTSTDQYHSFELIDSGLAVLANLEVQVLNLFTFRNFLNVKRLEALVPLGVGRVLLTTESDTGLGAVDVAVLNSVTFHTSTQHYSLVSGLCG